MSKKKLKDKINDHPFIALGGIPSAYHFVKDNQMNVYLSMKGGNHLEVDLNYGMSAVVEIILFLKILLI